MLYILHKVDPACIPSNKNHLLAGVGWENTKPFCNQSTVKIYANTTVSLV